MLSFAICDDSDFFRTQIKEYIMSYFINNNLDYVIEEFENGEKLLSSENKFDLIFLDYEFEDKGYNGIEIAKKLRIANDYTTIIFITSFPAIVFDSFEVDTFRFLVKPIDKIKLFKALDDFISRIKKDDFIQIKSNGSAYYIKESKISYIEAHGKYCIIYLEDSAHQYLEYQDTLSKVSELLGDVFYRCHKSFVVNMKYISSFDKSSIKMKNQKTIPISRGKRNDFMTVYSNYIINNA